MVALVAGLDTGDGAAISFLGNPEDALNVAMTMRNAIQESASPLDVRFGVNLGPVRLIKDLNGQLNIIGDGINVAERVMSFSSAGQLLVSRSYYEVVSRLDPLGRFGDGHSVAPRQGRSTRVATGVR